MIDIIFAFNWTKVELKHKCVYFRLWVRYAFNWTKVELKLNNSLFSPISSATFNWTKVELKQSWWCDRYDV